MYEEGTSMEVDLRDEAKVRAFQLLSCEDRPTSRP